VGGGVKGCTQVMTADTMELCSGGSPMPFFQIKP
jgi:hypothetical protein